MISDQMNVVSSRRSPAVLPDCTALRRRPLSPLGDLIFLRDAKRGVDVTARLCGDPEPGRSALDRRWSYEDDFFR